MKAPKCRLCGKEHWGACAQAAPRDPAPVRAEPVKTTKPKKTKAKAAPKKTAPPKPSRRPRGRPVEGQEQFSNEKTKPWMAMKISRRTWYRLQAKKEKQHAAS